MESINFFSDPVERPKMREDVRLNQLGFFVHENGRIISVGVELTPFVEPPCAEVFIVNQHGDPAGKTVMIDSMNHNFTLVMHLRDKEPTDQYQVTVNIFYTSPDKDIDRLDVDSMTAVLDTTVSGEQLHKKA